MPLSNKFHFERNKIFASNNRTFSIFRTFCMYSSHIITHFSITKKNEAEFPPFFAVFLFHTLMLHFLNLFSSSVFTTARKFLCFQFLLIFNLNFLFPLHFSLCKFSFPFCCFFFSLFFLFSRDFFSARLFLKLYFFLSYNRRYGYLVRLTMRKIQHKDF